VPGHPQFTVDERVTMIERSLEQISLSGDSGLRLSVAVPESTMRGAVVVAPGSRSVTGVDRQLATGLAGEGWLAVIPHLFHSDATERLTEQSVLADTGAVLGWLAQREVSADRVGVVGFGLGGAVALLVATQRELGAAVTVEGTGVVQPGAAGLPALVDVAPALRCPWLGIYGREGEALEEEVRKLQDAAHSARVATDLVRCRFDADCCIAPEAWTRTLNWFGSHMR
jgi:carboxymethylenebutenolidase